MAAAHVELLCGTNASAMCISSADEQLEAAQASLTVAIAVGLALWALPPLLRLVYFCLATRGTDEIAPTTQAGPGPTASEDAAVASLARAEAVAARQRRRVVFASTQLGWMLMVVSITPLLVGDLTLVAGLPDFYLSFFPKQSQFELPSHLENRYLYLDEVSHSQL